MQPHQPPPMPHHMQPGPMTPQQQHQNYHQLPPLPHSQSPHHNVQQPLRPPTGPSPHHHMQSPHHLGGPSPMHMQQQQPQQQQPQQLPPPSQQQLNQMNGPPLMPHAMGHHLQPGVQHSHGTFIGHGGPMPNPRPHYSHPPLPPNQQPPQIAQPLPPMHHGPPPPPQGHPMPPGYHPHVGPHNSNAGRGSPFYQNIPQSEFRIIELNKRLQNRPKLGGPCSPLPLIRSCDESFWWEKFACDFFDDDATLTLRITLDDRPVEFNLGRTLIPRYFRSCFEGGVVDLSIKLRNPRETAHHHMMTLECDQTDITTKNFCKYPPMNIVVHTEGRLVLEFVNKGFDQLVIKSWRFFTTQCHEFIDRSMTTTGLNNAYLVDPVTRSGLNRSTISFLRMCTIMEPMQELMLLHRQTKMDPRSCLKHLLYEKYQLKSVDDNRSQPNKPGRRRKRQTAAGAGTTNKKTKANANNANAMNNNNNNGNANSLMSPLTVSGMPNLSLASQDVMVVGEPSMLGADFGDENERRITRLENNQFDTPINSTLNSSEG